MNLEAITFLTVAVEGQKERVWIGLPELSRSLYVGTQRENKSIWSGYPSYALEERGWPNFVTAWYVSQIYAKALVNCVGLTAGNPLLDRCLSTLKVNKVPYEHDETSFVINFLTNKEKDIAEVLVMKPPIEYIEEVVSKGEGLRILFEADLLYNFLKENYTNIPESLLAKLTSYNMWRKKLAAQY